MSLILCFILGLIPTSYAKDFAGISFHSTVPEEQFSIFKSDLAYLYKIPHAADAPNLAATTGLSRNDGPHLLNWLVNRVQYIVGESYTHGVTGRSSVPFNMINIGSLYYGTDHQFPFDGKLLKATSPRLGLLQIGDSLFGPLMTVNSSPKSPANAGLRLGTLFHEGRHSDGRGATVGFSHVACPKGHTYAGIAACDNSSNGAYPLGAAVMRHFLRHCTQCSTLDKRLVELRILDSEERVLKPAAHANIPAFQGAVGTYENLIKTYTAKLTPTTPPQEKLRLQKEIAEFTKQRDYFNEQIRRARTSAQPALDATPQAPFKTITLQQSNQAFERSRQAR